MGTTLKGIPYVDPSDHPLEYPAAMQAQSDAIDALLNPPIMTILTPSSGWADFGGPYGGMFSTKQGRIAVVEGMVKPTADKAVTAGTSYPLMTGLPLPQRAQIVACVYIANATGVTPQFGRLTIDMTGAALFVPSTTGTIPTASGYVSFAAPYRTAS